MYQISSKSDEKQEILIFYIFLPYGSLKYKMTS